MRIWIYWNRNIARINVKPGCPVVLVHSEATDEGYHMDRHTYSVDPENPDRLLWCQESSACDCDGPIERTTELAWERGGPMVPMITWRPNGQVVELPEERPDWETVDAWQRDYFAEAAGY